MSERQEVDLQLPTLVVVEVVVATEAVCTQSQEGALWYLHNEPGPRNLC